MVELLIAACLFLAADSPPTHPSARSSPAADRKLADAWLAERRRIVSVNPEKDGSPDVKRRWREALAGEIPPPPIEHPLSVGAVGTLSGWSFRLVHRLGDSEGRVAIQKPPRRRDVGKPTSEKRKPPEVVVLLRGFDLSGMVDGQKHMAPGCFIVTKTETYAASSGGQRTLFVIEPYDSSKAESLFRQAVNRELKSD